MARAEIDRLRYAIARQREVIRLILIPACEWYAGGIDGEVAQAALAKVEEWRQ